MNQTVKVNTQKIPNTEVKKVTSVTDEDVFKEVHILLPTRTSASGIAINKTEYIAVDGITPYAYFYSFCGVFKGAVPTLRPYSQIVYCIETDSYFAIDSGCNSTVYILNCRLEETDKFQADCIQNVTGISLYNRSTSTDCPCSSTNCCQCSNQLLLTSPHEISAYSKNGSFLNSFARCNKDVYFTSFIKTQNGYAQSYEKNGCSYIRIVFNCAEAEIIVPKCTTLKNLFATDGGGIYGFFSKNYSNNFIIPLYENDFLVPNFNNYIGGSCSASIVNL